jgi:hypothetical protein
MWEYSKTQQDVIQQWIPASLQESLKKTLQKQKFKGESQQEVLFPCCVDSSSSAEWPYAFLLCVGMKENPIKTNTTEAQRACSGSSSYKSSQAFKSVRYGYLSCIPQRA